MKIENIQARQILDSRGNPALEVNMSSATWTARFGVPSGASTGSKEAVEKRDGNPANYQGLSVSNNIHSIDLLAKRLSGFHLNKQQDFDNFLLNADGSNDKSKLGANTLLGLSGAYLKLSALANNMPLWQHIAELAGRKAQFPLIYANLINGGKHAPGLDIQEFMVVPDNNHPQKAVEDVFRFRQALAARLLKEHDVHSLTIGDEGGFVPQHTNAEQVLKMFEEAKEESGVKVGYALDVAANSFYHNGQYLFEGKAWSAREISDYYLSLAKKFSIISIEDPFMEEDIEFHKELSEKCDDVFLVGDDTTVTRTDLIKKYSSEKAIGGVIIKPNQVGTISETFSAIEAAFSFHIKPIISHRSGETNDDFIADLAFGVGAYGVKIGSLARGERISKYNRLLEIAEEVDNE